MPSTITTYYSFTAGNKAKASEVNANFSNYRGTLIPIKTDTAAASHLEHDFGSTEHRWNVGYFGSVDFVSSTSTGTIVISPQTSNTGGALELKIHGATAAVLTPTGWPATSIQPDAKTIVALTFTASGTWTAPAGITSIFMYMQAGGGGGAGGDTAGDNGQGGAGVLPVWHAITVAPGDVLSITVGSGGTGGTGGNPGTAGGTGGSTIIQKNGTTITSISGGDGGLPTTTGNSGTSYNGKRFMIYGGFLNQTGGSSLFGAGGDPGPNTFGVGGGGGGGAGFGNGGAGGYGDNDGSGEAGYSASGYGAGGGGGGEGNLGGASGGNGGAGGPGFVVVYYTKNT